MPSPLPTNRSDSWIEDPSLAHLRDPKIIAAAGSNAPFLGSNDLLNLIPEDDPNYGLPSSSARDEINKLLDTSAFLYYPTDLGKNKRYHHFVVFNIYQGTSDEIRIKQREIDIRAAAITNNKIAGGWGSQLNGPPGTTLQTAAVNSLINIGLSPQQAEEFANVWFGQTGAELVFQGVTANESLNFLDNIFQGSLGPQYEEQLRNIDTEKDGGVFDKIKAGFGVAVEQGGKDIDNIIQGFLKASNRDNVAEMASQPDDTRKTATGKSATRSKKDRVLLAANRRFNLANVRSKDTICLYMPLKLTFNDQLVYTEEDMGMAKAAMDTVLGKRGAVSAMVERAGIPALANLVDGLLSQVGVESLNLNAVRAANTRRVANPRREALFKDVGLRQHNFSFEFAPRNPGEADMVLSIIKMFRYHAHPGLYGGGAHFLTFPAEFEASFYTIQSSSDANGNSVETVVLNDNLPKLPRLALSGIQVDYSSAGDYKTFKDGKPAFIRLDLTFQEMEQLTNEHIINGY
jgi:hypothetical protein